MKIIGYTVGTTLPKPNLKQTDPTKGDYIKGKEILDEKYIKVDEQTLTEEQKAVVRTNVGAASQIAIDDLSAGKADKSDIEAINDVLDGFIAITPEEIDALFTE